MVPGTVLVYQGKLDPRPAGVLGRTRPACGEGGRGAGRQILSSDHHPNRRRRICGQKLSSGSFLQRYNYRAHLVQALNF